VQLTDVVKRAINFGVPQYAGDFLIVEEPLTSQITLYCVRFVSST
jgi:hypothetical protein